MYFEWDDEKEKINIIKHGQILQQQLMYLKMKTDQNILMNFIQIRKTDT